MSRKRGAHDQSSGRMIDALVSDDPHESAHQLLEGTDELRLLAQIANGLIAAHARIDVLENRLIASTKLAVKTQVESFESSTNARLAKLESKLDNSVKAVSQVYNQNAAQISQQIASAVSTSTSVIRSDLTAVEQALDLGVEHNRSITDGQVGRLYDWVRVRFEQLDQRLDKAEKEQIASTKRVQTIALRWRFVFLLLGLAMLSPHAYQVFRIVMRGIQ